MQYGHREREWLDLAGELMSHPLTSMPTEQLALQLCRTFEARACSFTHIEFGRLCAGEVWPLSEPLGGYRPQMHALMRTGENRHPLIDMHPLVRFFSKTGRTQPAQTCEVPQAIVGLHSLRSWNEIGSAMGCPDQLALPLSTSSGHHSAFVAGREGRYGHSEMETATLLWRLLTGLDQQVRAIAGSRLDITAGDDLRLTARELAVLGLLANGLTAHAIGRRLGAQHRTVQKHLEHIYTKLGVRDRLSAVLRARNAGLLPAQRSGRARSS